MVYLLILDSDLPLFIGIVIGCSLSVFYLLYIILEHVENNPLPNAIGEFDKKHETSGIELRELNASRLQ